MKRHTRRSFLGHSVLALAATPFLGARGANEQINLGFIGLGDRGRHSLGWFSRIEGVKVTHLCDPDQHHVDRAAAGYPEARKSRDLRRVLEDKDVDAVVISTCNHWHSLATIWACQAGKHVYVEKPGSHNVWEGKQMVAAARKYDRIVQGGLQQRSDPFQTQLKAYLDTGALGAIKYVRLNRYGVRGPIGRRAEPLEPPASVEYNLWLGPAADQPIYRDKLHYDWHWDFNTGNGDLGNWAPHILDDLRNVVFRDRITLPRRVLSAGGRLKWNDGGDTPNTQFVYYDTGDVPVIMCVRNMENLHPNYARRRTRAFLVIECENGYYAGGRGGGTVFDQEGNRMERFSGDAGGGHAQNFIDTLRAGDRSQLNAEIEQTHFSSAWAHLGNLSYRLGNAYDRETAERQVPDLAPWAEVIDEFHQHLEANEVDPAQEKIRLGPMIEVDVAAQTLRNATPEALALFRRTCRTGFEVPEQV